MSVGNALDRFQPMHRINLSLWSAFGGGALVFLVMSDSWFLGSAVLAITLLLRFLTDQLLLSWCLYKEFPGLSDEQRRSVYRRYISGWQWCRN